MRWKSRRLSQRKSNNGVDEEGRDGEDFRKVIPKLSVFGTDEKSKIRERVEARVKTLSDDELTKLQMSSQRVVTSEEAEQLINNGYRLVGVLPNGKVIVQK